MAEAQERGPLGASSAAQDGPSHRRLLLESEELFHMES